MSNTKTIIERKSFECPKVGRLVHLEFERRQFFSGEFASPLNETDSAVRGCEGERDCGVRPQTSPTSWGMPDWTKCVYANFNSNGTLKSR